MARHHGADIYFCELSLEHKRKTVESLLLYMKSFSEAGQLHFYNANTVRCNCELTEWERSNHTFYELHLYTSDHVALK